MERRIYSFMYSIRSWVIVLVRFIKSEVYNGYTLALPIEERSTKSASYARHPRMFYNVVEKPG